MLKKLSSKKPTPNQTTNKKNKKTKEQAAKAGCLTCYD